MDLLVLCFFNYLIWANSNHVGDNYSNLFGVMFMESRTVSGYVSYTSGLSSVCTTLQSFTGPVQGQNRVFPVKFSTQGKTCFHYREPLFLLQGPLFSLQGFPCEKTSQGKPCFYYGEWVCSVFWGGHKILWIFTNYLSNVLPVK